MRNDLGQFIKGNVAPYHGKKMPVSLRKKISDSHVGVQADEKHPFWKGSRASYNAKHLWLYRKLGKAKACSANINHQEPYHWANVSGDYLRDVNDYIELCIFCHRAFDRKSSCKRGHEFSLINTYIRPDGYRSCKACQQLRATKHTKVEYV